MTTETDLINAFSALSVDARAVLAALPAFGTGTGNVTITLANGQSFTFQTIPTQIAQWAAQQAADRLAFHNDFGGTPPGQTITRDGAGNITGTVTTFASGWSLTKTYTRYSSGVLLGRMQTITYTLKDALSVTQATGTRTINYDASNRLASIS